MKTISQEEFTKKYGEVTSNLLKQTAEQPGYLSRVGAELKASYQGLQKTTERGAELMGGGKVVEGAVMSVLGAPAAAVRAAFSPITAALSPLIESGLKATGVTESKTVQDTLAGLDTWAKAHPDAAENLKNIFEIGSTVGVGKLATAVKPALERGALKTAEKGAGLVSATGRVTEKGGKKLYSTAFDLTADEARLVQGNKINISFLQKERAKFPKGSKEYKTLTDQIDANKLPVTRATTALEKGIAGTEKQVGVKAGVEKMDVWKNKLEPALKASKDTMTKDELLAGARKRVADELEPTRKLAMQNALDSIEADYANFSPTDLLTMNKIKTGLDTFTPSKIFKGQEVASELKTLKAEMASAIRQKTYTSLKDINAKRAYIDYGNLKQLEKVGIKALTEAGTKGGFGGFWSTVYDMATVPVKTIGGKVLYRVGNKLEFMGEKGVKTLRQHLESKGIKIKQP